MLSDTDQDNENKYLETFHIEVEDLPLHNAVQCYEIDIICTLVIKNSQSINLQNNLGKTALYLAAERGYKAIVNILLSYGADINIPSIKGNTPLHAAIWSEESETAEYIIRNGADLTACTETGLMPIHFAVKKNLKPIVKLILNKNVHPIDVKTIYGFTPLHYAAKNQDPELVELFVSNGIKADTLTRNNQTPLHIAAQWGNVEVARYLVNMGVEVDPKKRDGSTPLHLAAEREHLDMIKFLIQQGADVNLSTSATGSPLHRATHCRNPKAAKILLNNGALVNAKAEREATPLHLAVQHSCVEMIKLLLEYDADPNIQDASGQNPLCLFVGNDPEIPEMLLDYDVNVNEIDKVGKTALFQIYINGGESVAIMELLVKFMARMIAADQEVSEKNRLLFKLKYPGEYYERCKQEIELMKMTILDGTYNITFFDVFTKGVQKLAIYARCKNVVDAFNEGNYKEVFPLYAKMLERRFLVGKERSDLFEAAEASFNLLFLRHPLNYYWQTIQFRVPDLIVRNLFKFFNVRDLRHLAKLSKESCQDCRPRFFGRIEKQVNFLNI